MGIDEYIRDNLAKGFSEQRIKDALLKAGYDESDIKDLIEKAKAPEDRFSVLMKQISEREAQKSGQRQKAAPKEEIDEAIASAAQEKQIGKPKDISFEDLLPEREIKALSQKKIHTALMAVASFIVIFTIPGVMLFLGQFAVYANYVWTMILSVICGLVSMFLIEKTTDDDRKMIKASTLISLICAIAIPLCFGVLKILKTNLGILDNIIRFPDPIITGVIIFMFFNTAYIVEELRKRNTRMVSYYGIGLVIVLAFVVSSRYLMGLFS